MASTKKAQRLTQSNIIELPPYPVPFKGKQHKLNILQATELDFLVQANHATKTLIEVDDTIVASGHFKAVCETKRGKALRPAGKKLEDYIEVLAVRL